MPTRTKALKPFAILRYKYDGATFSLPVYGNLDGIGRLISSLRWCKDHGVKVTIELANKQ